MANTDTVTFNDAEAYERFMGRWSRAVGAIFLDWIAPPRAARWLDIGCGTGIFTELIINTCSPAAVVAVDPAVEQITYARNQPVGQLADFRVADALKLPFSDGAFEVVASALVINFIPDRPRALAEMRRVGRPGATIAAYVWDLAGGYGPGAPLIRAMARIHGNAPPVPGTEDSSLEALSSLFERTGFEAITTDTIEVARTYPDFDDFWRAQTPSFNPLTKIIGALPDEERVTFIHAVRTELLISSDGSIAYSARANAIKARVPK